MAERKIALITGAGTGIGKAAALALARAGWSMTLTGRRKGKLDEVASEASAAGAEVFVKPSDISDPASVAELFAEAKRRFGRLDLLFNNAGVGAPSVPLEDITFEQWKAVIDTNITGAFLCTQEAIRIMKAQTPQGGRIINNGSIAATSPRPLSGPYTASKHAITGLTKSTSLDCRAYNIACGQIDIGNAATEMTEPMAAGILQADGSKKPEPRMDVKHVGDAIVYMASLPLEANVQFMTVMATKMPFVGRG